MNRMTLFFIASLGLLAVPAAASGAPLYLQSLVPTSGENGAVMLDGNLETGWSPAGDPSGEGVLFRFEEPVLIDALTVKLCPGSGQFRLVPYINGTETSAKKEGREGEVFSVGLSGSNNKVRSVFLRVSAAEGVPCVAEVAFKKGSVAMNVAPPRALAGSVEASSTLKPIDAYHVGYLFDGRTDFGWVEGAKGLGKGESVTLTLDQPAQVVALELWNGYQRSKDHFRKNARATKLKLSVDGGEPIVLKVKDVMGSQKLTLPKAVKAKEFVLTIVGARKGKRYPDLVLSELRLWDKSGPMTVRTPDKQERREALEQELADTPLAEVVDRQFSCVCCDFRATRLKFRTNHTFVWYLDSEQEGETENRSKSEVFDGAWVVGKPKPPSATVKLFGRRHKTSSVFNPYAGNRVRDTVRIGGGNLLVTRLADIDAEQFAALVRSWAKGPTAAKVECLDVTDEGAAATYELLKGKGGIFIQGRAITDLMVHEGR
jgi:hypothetical protein